MAIEDNPQFPRFNMVSNGLRDAEDKFLRAIESGSKAVIVDAKLGLMAALDEYRKAVGSAGEGDND
jgi:hypothetical protein